MKNKNRISVFFVVKRGGGILENIFSRMFRNLDLKNRFPGKNLISSPWLPEIILECVKCSETYEKNSSDFWNFYDEENFVLKVWRRRYFWENFFQLNFFFKHFFERKNVSGS